MTDPEPGVAEMRVVDVGEAPEAFEELVRTTETDTELIDWMVSKPQRPGGGGVLALAGTRAQGLLTWAPHPGYDGIEQQYLTLRLRRSPAPPAVTALLLDALAGRFAQRPAQVWLHAEEAIAHLGEVLEAHGFRQEFVSLEYRGALPLARLEPRPDARLVRYEGGDDTVNDAIAEVHRRGYRGRRGTPLFTPTVLQHGAHMILAYDGDRLAGFVSWGALEDHALCDSIVVARRWFGTGMAHTLGCAFSDDAVAAGADSVRCHVHETNHASRSLVERFGLSVHRETRSYTRSFP